MGNEYSQQVASTNSIMVIVVIEDQFLVIMVMELSNVISTNYVRVGAIVGELNLFQQNANPR